MKLYFKDIEHEIKLKRRTGALKEQMRILRDKFMASQDFLALVQNHAIDSGKIDIGFNEQVKLAYEDKVITNEMFKDFVYNGSSRTQKMTDIFYCEMLQLITDTSEMPELMKKEFEKPVFNKTKFTDFWGDQDIIEVENTVKSFRAELGV